MSEKSPEEKINEAVGNIQRLALRVQKYREALSKNSVRILGDEYPLTEQMKDKLTAKIGEMESQMDQEIEKLKKA